jgi:hypothetical protein
MNSLANILAVAKNAQKIAVTVKETTEILTLNELECTFKFVDTLIVELFFEYHKIVCDCNPYTIGTKVLVL